MSKTVWIFAGEASGDQYGARLAVELRAQAPGLRLQGMGGGKMRAAGVEILADSSELGVIGLVEVLKHYPTFHRIFHSLLDRARRERPDAVVLIDYPGFNLRFAARLRRLGIRVVYYVSPQVWAWGRRRIPKIAATVDRMLCIFPFEPEVYAGTGLATEFVGHPLLEIVAAHRDPALARDPDTILLLPGSRRGEIDRLAVPILETALALRRAHPRLQFVMAAPREQVANDIRHRLGPRMAEFEQAGIRLVVGETQKWMQVASCGLAASGTVTVEAAMFGLPLVVVYRVNPVTYAVGRLLVKLPFFTMVNLIAGRRLFEEFLQGEVRPPVLVPALERILPGGTRRTEVEQGLVEVVAALSGGDAGAVARRAAAIVLEVAAKQ